MPTQGQVTRNNTFSIPTSRSAVAHPVPNVHWTSNRSTDVAKSCDTTAPSSNKILTSLPAGLRQRLLPHLRRVLLHQDDILHDIGAMPDYVYFVEKGLVSLVTDTCEDAQIEACIIGHEGMVGAACVLGNQPAVHRAVVQIPGKAYRLPMRTLQEEWPQNHSLQEWIFRYMSLMMAQASQAALCNRFHTIENRLARWLLTIRDRVESDRLELTHQYISEMLGVRRPSVTLTLGMMQQSGQIDCGRGHITIINEREMENCSCECYGVLRRQFRQFEEQV